MKSLYFIYFEVKTPQIEEMYSLTAAQMPLRDSERVTE